MGQQAIVALLEYFCYVVDLDWHSNGKQRMKKTGVWLG
jgi:hypothetical protein